MDPKIPESKQCLNCQNPMAPGDSFCGICGQKYTTGKVSIFQLLKELIGDIFSLDSTVIRSIPLLLFRPGKLTTEYFSGKHKSYVSPIRLFLFSSLAYFAILTFYSSGIIEEQLRTQLSEEPKSRFLKATYKEELSEDLDSMFQELKVEFPANTSLHNQLDSTLVEFQGPPMRDSINLTDFTIGGQKFSTKISQRDLFTKKPEEIIAPFEFQNMFHHLLILKVVKIMADGGSFIEFLFKRLSWLIFMMIPLFALVMKLLFLRRKRYYIEHLIFGLHFHSFLFLIGSLMMFVIPFSVIPLITIFSIYILAYLFLAMRRYYGQSFLKTFLKYCFLLFSFLFLINIAIFSLIALSLAIY